MGKGFQDFADICFGFESFDEIIDVVDLEFVPRGFMWEHYDVDLLIYAGLALEL